MTALLGTSLFIPPIPGITVTPSFQTTFALGAAAGDKMAMMGRVVHAARTGTKNINKVHFNFGVISKALGANIKISLQDVSLTAGPIMQPDGTPDQSYTILNADANFASHAWYTATLDATRTVTHGELLAVVWEWDSFVSTDTAIVKGLALSSVSTNAGAAGHQNVCALYTAGAWTATPVSMVANVILEFDDGTFGTLDGAMPAYSASTTVGSAAINTGTTPDEYCLEFQMPFACEVDGMYALVNAVAGADFNMVLYSGTTALATVTVDANAMAANSSGRWLSVRFPKVALAANTTYRVAILPTTANSVTVYYFDVNAEAHAAVLAFGTTGQTNTRTDAGAWGTATETRRLFAGIRLCGVGTESSHAFVG